MDYKKVIAESWQATQVDKKVIIWFGFIPALFTTVVGVGYIAYQFFAFKKSYLFSEDDGSFLHDVASFIFSFVKLHVSWTVPLIVAVAIFLVIYLLFPTLAKAAAIQTIARRRNGQEAGVGTGFKHGMMRYLPLFEYHLLIKTFSFFSVLTEMSFVIRNLGLGIFNMLLVFFILFMVVGFLLTVLFTYSDFYIVVDGLGVFESMKRSAKLVVMNWRNTFLVTILMILIGVRIILQVVLVFLIPALVLLITGYIATVTLPVTGLIVGSVVGFIGLIVAAYLNGIVDVFSYTVWTFTFLELSAEKEVSAREVLKDEIPDHHQNLGHHKNL